MFAVSESPIDPAAEREKLRIREAGGFVSFEGWVRTLNQGREVLRLEYEASPELAAHEFARIEAEARDRFEILDLHCVHRSGMLQPGELAVWIGVTATHRDAAFTACRFIIDELKQRLPVWKKEHYADGDSGWLENP